MEIVLGVILELAKITSVPIRDCCNNHRHVDEHMKNLREKWQDLDHLKSDIKSRMEEQIHHQGKPGKLQVTGWIQRVENMHNEIQAIESENEEVKCFLRACVGKHALKKTLKVGELYQTGSLFPDSLVDDLAVRKGEEFATTKLIGEITTGRVMSKILAEVLNDDVRMIGVSGMGGIGKSTIMEHIYNHLLKETNKFDSVIWVTVSKSYDVIQLQNDIAHKLDLDLKDNNKRDRAAKIMKEFKRRKRCVLILDDLWEAFDLKEEVGIPESRCKIVFTTRDLNVCQGMRCKHIKMELLSQEEARDLFFHKMEDDVKNNPFFKEIAEEVLQTCAQLPLAIVTMARSFQCLTTYFEWKDALGQLRTSLKGFAKMEEKVYKTLEFSYVRLKDERLKEDELKQCLLHCALYPEDFKIYKNELIEHLIDEGIIERMESRQAEFDRGNSILKRLENACLLEGGIAYHIPEGKFVKIHDLVRDMVLEVASPQFMVEGRLGLEDFSNGEKWREDLVKASLMYKGISTIPSNVSPMCPNLSTLLLQGNKSLKNVPNSLFKHLHGLKVLDLSYTGIKSLPNSVFSLEMLTTLRLRRCRRLKHMSSLAKLTALWKLDLGGTGITEIPDGLEMLVNLTYLNLNAKNLKIMPLGILPKLSGLQYLRFSCIVIVKREEIERLKKLENVWVRFDDLYEFRSFRRYLEKRQLECYQIQVGKSVEDCDQKIEDVGKSVILEDCNFRGDESLVLPEDLQFLKIKTCEDLRSLSLKHVRKLKKIRIEDCEGIEHVVSSTSPSYSDSLLTLEILELLKLKNLRGLFRQERAASGWVPLDTFSRLKVISIHECPIKKLLPLGLHLNNLEEIQVENCLELEEIIGEASDEFEEKEEGMDTTKITLPSLRVLDLTGLPELKTICSSSKVIVCDSLEKICISKCPKLKRLPLSLPFLSNGQLSPPPSLKERAASARVPLNTFSSLKVILIVECPIKKLLPLGSSLHLHNLEKIQVKNCLELEEIITEACDEFVEDEEEKEEKGMDTTKITLPKLRDLSLSNLPELKTICSSSRVIVCDSLERIKISKCPKLKRLPLSLPRLSDGQLSPPPSLKEIEAYDKGWWESLEWDYPDTKNVLQPFIHKRPYPLIYSPYMPYYVTSVEEDPNACTIC